MSRAITMLEDAQRGCFADLQWTYSFIEQTDPDMIALVERRTSAILEMDFNVKSSAEDDSPDKALADAQVKALAEAYDKIDNLYEAIEHLAMAAFRGHAHCEKWFTGGELTHLEIVDPWNVVRDGLRGPWKYNPEAKVTGFDGLPAENEIKPENFLIRTVARPINRIALFKFIRQNLSQKDWDAFIEIYGIPGAVVIGPPNIPEGEEAKYEAAAQAIAEGASGYAPNGTDVKFSDSPRGTNPFRDHLTYLTEKLILAGTGGLLTMLSAPGSGTLAGNAHTDTFDQIASAEARRISEIINRQLVEPWLEAAFPGQPPLAYFDLAANEEADVSEIVEHAVKLSQAGFLLDPEELSEKTGYKLTVKPTPAPLTQDGRSGSADALSPPVIISSNGLRACATSRWM
jgi:phage gp29-like protein